MDKDFKTRPFEDKDLAGVAHINWTCLPENYSDSFFLDVHRSFPRTFIVATVDEKIVGYIMCRVEVGFSEIKSLRMARKGHIISLAVLPEHRKKGIAHALLSEVLRNISEYGAGECYLEVRISNKPAIDLYQDFEFKKSRMIRGYYRDGEDAYVMTKLLT